RPDLPPLKEFIDYLEVIWDSRVLTNNGPFLQKFEAELAKYLGVEYISVFNNGTSALMCALRALNVHGEVITTPFSFVGTAHAMYLNGIQPVFADIEPEYFNLDPDRVEQQITPATTAIVPVHIYGNPCNHSRFEQIAKKHNLRLIYDAAHAFGVKEKNESILNYGDMAIISFHATKVFHTMEGGAVICHSKNAKSRLDNLRNFGITGEESMSEPGFNAKMNEMQAALGLLQLKHIDNTLRKRQDLAAIYKQRLKNIAGIRFIDTPARVKSNNGYFPIQVNAKEYGKDRDRIYDELKQLNIYTRKYFSPLISQFSPYKDHGSASAENLLIASIVSKEILCLPIYADFDEQLIDTIVSYLRKQ
ncbi:MAG: DegT/DnrJ/EryC1/StrS family aminotransferase, partial [Bacteroidota bacterium]|nr:DegT/DnrJ/EryC1/StrS family aminotransferase [Bacteroidota bacterium]